MKKLSSLVAAGLVISATFGPVFAQQVATTPSAVIELDNDDNRDDIENAQRAKVSLLQAVRKVSEQHSGAIITANLERKEDDLLVYEIDLVTGGDEVEVWVNAETGELSELMED